MNKALKEEYKEAFLQVRQVVNTIDPMGLIDCCGSEEYDPEVSEILTKLHECGTEEEIEAMVIQVFTRWFDEPGNIELYKSVGHDLINIKNSHSWLNRKAE